MTFKILGRLGSSALDVAEVRKMVKKSGVRNRDTIARAVKKGLLERVGRSGICATLKGMALYEARRLGITPLSLMLLIHVKYRMVYSEYYYRDYTEFGKMYYTYVIEQTFNACINDLVGKGLLTQISKGKWRVSKRPNQKIVEMVFDRMMELTDV